MKILVYGAGVIGCELAHVLHRGGNDVTLLARGEWKDTLQQNGLIIRHYLQRKNTTDRLQIIERLDADDPYDMIFVVMQADQVAAVLPAVSANVSRRVIFVGNHPWAEKTEQIVKKSSPVKKEIAFAFMASGGRREDDRVVSIHLKLHMTVGGSRKNLSHAFRECLASAFSGTGCRLIGEKEMDVWLKCHMAEILPFGYISYATDCNLTKTTRAQRRAMVEATAEAFALLRALGYPIKPAEDEALYTGGVRKKVWQAVVYMMCKTPLGRLMVSDHCAHAVSEMTMLDGAWEKLRRERPETAMPVWDLLRKSMPTETDIRKDTGKNSGGHNGFPR